MAQHKDYGLVGAGRNLQLGKLGPKLEGNADSGAITVSSAGGTLSIMRGANAIGSTDFVTKSQLDVVSSSAATDGFSLQLGNVDASGDGDWHITPNQGDYDGNSSVARQGAVTTFTNTSTVSEAIDKLNETTLNVYNNTFVRDVSFTVDSDTGGSPLVSTLNISATGNANRYTIDWGDGSSTTATTDSTPTHTYTDNSNSPFDVTVTAFNNAGAGEGSSASLTKADFITLYTANPVADFDFYAAASGGSAVTSVDDGTSLYFDNETTNINDATIQFTIDWGDSTADSTITNDAFPGGSAGSRLAHTFTSSTEQEQTYTVELSLDSHSTADPSVIPSTATKQIKVYDTHTPEVALDDNSGINEESTSGHQVQFTNNTENTIGSYADYGIQYRYVWGDGTTSTVNVGSGSAGDTGGTINHTYELSSSEQANGTAVDYTGNLEVISNHSSSPFKSGNFTVHVEPDVRATITGSSTTSNLKSSNDNIRTLYKGTDLSGTNRAVLTVDNTSQNGDSFEYDFGDSSANVTVTEASSGAGSVSGANVTHDYSSASTGNKTVTMVASGTPDITAQTDSDSFTVKVEDVPSAPAGLSSKSITWSTSTDGTSPKLASGFNDVGSTGLTAGDSLSQSTVIRRDTTSAVQTSVAGDAYNSASGTLSAVWNGSTDGSVTFTTTAGETGVFDALTITAEGDANDQISSTTYPKNFYQVFSARVSNSLADQDYGAHKTKLSHDATGDTNEVFVVYDNLSTTPTIDVSGASLAEETAGTKRYISGIPYYNTGNPQVKVVGATVSNWIGQAYRDSSQIWFNSDGTNYESTSQAAIQEEYRSYADIDGASTMLASGVPTANVGIASAYALGDVVVDITTSSNVKTVETIKFQMQNVNGAGAMSSEVSEKIQVYTATPTGLDSEEIAVADSLGATHDDDGKRVTGFGASADNPTFSSSTNFYTDNAWSGAETIAGTAEAVVRFGTLQHYDTDLSSGYLPVGPDLATGRSGAQYFTFAFRRTTMANFDFTFTGQVSGVWIAAPGTDIDDASGINGWLDASTTYGGAGTPGSDTGNGGNGSDGCAFTSGDRVPTGSSVSNQSYTLTLGDQNATNSTGNNILVRIKLEDGDSITALSIS